MRRSIRWWKLVKQVPLLDDGSLDMTVGPTRVAVGDYGPNGKSPSLRAILSRDAAVEWRGRFVGVQVEWLSGDRLLIIYAGRRADEVGIWDVPSRRWLWKLRGRGVKWGDRVVTLDEDGDVAVRDASDGGELSVYRRALEPASECSLHVTDDLLLGKGYTTLHALDLPSGKVRWRLKPGEACHVLAGPPLRPPQRLDKSRVGVQVGGHVCLVSLRTGKIRWSREVGMDCPLVALDRIGYCNSRRVVVLDGASGRTITDRPIKTGSFYEAPPNLFGRWMVVVSESGHILTVDLESGQVLGVQSEPMAHFRDCSTVGAQLWVSGTDGSLSIYEPNSRA